MSGFGWMVLLVLNYICMYSNNSLKLGGVMLLLSVIISFLMSVNYLSWLSLIFFVMYIGGLLVLFFYLSSLKYNPLFSYNSLSAYKSVMVKVNMLMLFFLGSLNYVFLDSSFNFLNNKFKKFSNNLFKEEEFVSLLLVGIMLLLVLWLVTKLTFNTRGAMRPTF